MLNLEKSYVREKCTCYRSKRLFSPNRLSLSLLYDTTRLCVLSIVCIIYTIIQFARATKTNFFHKFVDKRNGCRFIIYNIRAKIIVQGRYFFTNEETKRACSVTGAQGRTECAKAEKPPYSSPQIVSRHIKKAQHIMLRVF